MSKKKNKQVYFNDGQLYNMYIGANSETIIASRRFGKSDGIIAPRMLRNAQAMPKSAGAIYAATFQQALSRTIPAAVHALSRWGFKNEKHFFIGRKAPKHLNFEKPYIEPQSWDHVIHWYNGRIQHLLSADVKFSANSLTLDDLMIDEGRSITNPEKLQNEVIPAVSGMIGHFANVPYHKGITVVSDMPQGKIGDWILNRKKMMDPELIKTIEGTLAEILRLKSLPKTKSTNKQIAYQKYQLFLFRKNAHLYTEYDSIVNLELLGESYIKRMKRELSPLVFQTSIMNRRITKLANGFYANLDERLHYYSHFDNNYLNNLRTDRGSFDLSRFSEFNYLQDADVDRFDFLYIALDYNANINWIVTGQPDYDKQEMRTLKSFFVKNQRKLRDVVRDWVDYYQPHPTRTVVYYYTDQALQGAYAVSNETFKDIVEEELKKGGWLVNSVYIGKQMRHDLKHQYINDALTGIKYLLPMFNKNNNEQLLPALEQTGIKIGRNGFEKDKSGEKLPETDADPLELRTDGTDAWDDLFIGLNWFPQSTNNVLPFGSVFMGN